MSSIESPPEILPSLRDLEYTKDDGAGLIQENSILRKQRNYLIDRLATEHKNHRVTSEMMVVATTTIAHAQRDNKSLRLADDFNANIKGNPVLLEALGEHAGNSHEGITKILRANAEGIVVMKPLLNLYRAVKGKRFVTPQGDDFVADLEDKEMARYRPALINSKSTSTGVVVADAEVIRPHLHASLIVFANCRKDSDSTDSDSTDSDSIDSSDGDDEEDSASGSGTDSDDSDSEEEVRPSKKRKTEDVEPLQSSALDLLETLTSDEDEDEGEE